MKSTTVVTRTVVTVLLLIRISAAVNAASPSWMLIPGRQAGSVQVRLYPKGLPLPNPDYDDGAMFHYTFLWVSKARDKSGMPVNTVAIESTSMEPVNNTPGERIHCVRVTSPRFHDEHGLSTGSTLASIERVYKHLKPSDQKPTVLIDSARGIGFEFASTHPSASSKCVAVDIFERDGSVNVDASDIHEMVVDWKNSHSK